MNDQFIPAATGTTLGDIAVMSLMAIVAVLVVIGCLWAANANVRNNRHDR